MSTDPSQSQQRPPTEEEMRTALEEELKRVRVEQVVTEATISILNISVMRSGLVPGSEGERDLDQVAVGIEAVRSLLPLVEQLAGEQAKPIRDALSQLQLAYVRAREEQSGAGGGEGGSSGGEPGGGATPEGQQPSGQQQGEPGAGPAQKSGRLWVPGQ